MDVNLPVPAYYKKGFIDPMYVPYQKRPSPITGCPEFPWKGHGDPYLVQFDLERINRGMSFQRKDSNYRQCPAGWRPGAIQSDEYGIKVDDGWCFKEEPEFEPVFYTKKAHRSLTNAIQYESGYAPVYTPPTNQTQSKLWDGRSQYRGSAKELTNFGKTNAKYSYLG